MSTTANDRWSNAVSEVLDLAPPHNADAERGLLGAVLVAGRPVDTLAIIAQIVGPADLYLEADATIYRAMLALQRDGIAIDTLTLADALKQRGELETIGGAAYLADVLRSCPTAANAEHYAGIVRDDSRKRRVRRLLEKGLIDSANGKAPEDLLTTLRRDIDAIGRGPGGAIYRPILTRLSDVQPEPVSWLWPGRIALGKLTLIAGDPGLGKSFLSLDLAARVSLGSPWPDDQTARAPRGGVVLLNAEDALGDTVRPRLDAMGADVSRIVAIEAVQGEDRMPVNLQRDIAAIDEAISSVADCRLVIIDPISAYLGKVDSHNNADVRALLAPLGELAERNKVALVVITHLNKGNGGSALYRATGSLAFVAAARAAWLVAKDQDTKGRRLFLPAKNNLAGDTLGMAFDISPDSVLRWEPDPVVVDADKALEPRVPDADDASGWLLRTLADGPMPAKEIFEAARAEGITQKQLRLAKTKIGADSRKAGFGGGWVWCLPGEDALEGAQGALPEKQGALDTFAAPSANSEADRGAVEWSA